MGITKLADLIRSDAPEAISHKDISDYTGILHPLIFILTVMFMFIILNGVKQSLTLARWLAYLLVLLTYVYRSGQTKLTSSAYVTSLNSTRMKIFIYSNIYLYISIYKVIET